MSEQITKTTEILAPYSLLERALEHYSAAHFNMHDFKHSSGKVFTWNGKTWTCTGVPQNREILRTVTIAVLIVGQIFQTALPCSISTKPATANKPTAPPNRMIPNKNPDRKSVV